MSNIFWKEDFRSPFGIFTPANLIEAPQNHQQELSGRLQPIVMKLAITSCKCYFFIYIINNKARTQLALRTEDNTNITRDICKWYQSVGSRMCKTFFRLSTKKLKPKQNPGVYISGKFAGYVFKPILL